MRASISETYEPRGLLAERDKVVTLGYYEGVARKAGRSFKSEWAMVFTLSRRPRRPALREYVDAQAINAAF